ncbi:serine/threonine-protein kinase [Chamaesiphon minutus]|uniref:WD40 repeat-containing protein n=1 Tax=Chamaesiphon minutus (strain ATCC 27169 / PCC 6605) TaxID=1173020 RepID=K9ULM4_CHAP6|nr:serine/threonine-protein kinase [Chamaesiphon minutus]AFY96007.1 WD40 repeat-containing protein [Chamaesiphon minutus PCC 6605]
MSYCLNPSCVRPENPPQSNFCRSCGGRLRLRDRYLAVEPIGQGGFGRTFKAIDEDKPSKPFCVIKQFFPQVEGTNAAQKAAELFTQEASALEQLDYPNIPELLAYFITPDGRQYLVQEFIDGQNLKTELELQGKFSVARTRELLLTILPTLAYIHHLGFIHRDIKPENIIRRTNDGSLYLVDFGAAKIASAEPPAKGTTIGTPEFMAPEQGWGKAFVSSDLYSLGMTCLNLLTGVSPLALFDDSQNRWIWRDSLTTEIDPKLGAVLDKLIEPRPIDRYQTAKEAIEALQADLISNLPVAVTPDSPPAIPTTNSAPVTYLPTINTSNNWSCNYTFEWHRKPINTLDLSTDGRYLISGDDGGTVAIWNLSIPQQPIATYSTNNAIYAVAISPNLSQVASGDKKRRVQLRRKESVINSVQELRADLSNLDSHNGFVYSVRFSPDGKILASGGADRRIRLWNAETSKIIYTLDGHQESVMAMQFMLNGKILISAGADRTIRFWDLEHKQLLKTIEAHTQTIHALAISRDNKVIISGSTDRTVQVRQLGTSTHHTLQGHQDGVLSVAISPDGKTIASGSMDGVVNLWDADTKSSIASFQAHQSAVKSIVFHPQGQTLITASWDRTIKIWQAS